LFPKLPIVLAELLKEHVVLYAMLEKATLTEDPFAAVMPLTLKLASELEMVICAVAAEAFMPSEVAFSATE
jgi:hypothetical protein